ncbi:MAG: hypothetical protein AB7L84_15140 [Acidimicrobiia bacterium]
MAGPKLVLVDAGMVAGFRRSTPSLLQLHQAVIHLHRQHPDAHVAVIADPSLKWDLPAAEQVLFDGDIVARAVVCAPAGAIEGTLGFLSRTAARAVAAEDHDVVAVTDRAVPDVAIGRLRNESGRWVWDLTETRMVDAEVASGAAKAGARRRVRRKR